MKLYKELEQKGLKTGWKQCGSLCLARSADRVTVFRRMKAKSVYVEFYLNFGNLSLIFLVLGILTLNCYRRVISRKCVLCCELMTWKQGFGFQMME